jgi:hypothetical protein
MGVDVHLLAPVEAGSSCSLHCPGSIFGPYAAIVSRPREYLLPGHDAFAYQLIDGATTATLLTNQEADGSYVSHL